MLSQVQLISYIINTKDYSVISQNNLDDKFFFNYKAEFNFIKNHYEQYRAVPDKLTFLNVFPEFDVVEVNEPLTYLLEQLYSDYNASYLATRFNKIKKMLENNETDAAVDYFMKSTENLHVGSVMSCTNLLEDTSRYDRYLERTTNQSKFYISTGFPELDKIIGGIDRENEDFVISARPGQGKTQLLVKMACAASVQGLTVGIFEGEMSKDKIGYRIDTFLGHIKNSSMNRGDLYIQKEYERYIKSLAVSGYGPIKIITQNDVAGDMTVDALRAFIEKEHLDILFIDQYSLLEDKRHGKQEFERVGNIAKDIKSLQVEKHIPIISVSQMNRTKTEGELDTSQISLSDKIPQYATILIMLEQKDQEETDPNNPKLITLNITKSRDGGDHRKVQYGVNFNTGEWNYIPNEKDGITSKAEIQSIKNSYAPVDDCGENVF